MILIWETSVVSKMTDDGSKWGISWPFFCYLLWNWYMLLLLRLADPGCPTIILKTQSTYKSDALLWDDAFRSTLMYCTVANRLGTCMGHIWNIIKQEQYYEEYIHFQQVCLFWSVWWSTLHLSSLVNHTVLCFTLNSHNSNNADTDLNVLSIICADNFLVCFTWPENTINHEVKWTATAMRGWEMARNGRPVEPTCRLTDRWPDKETDKQINKEMDRHKQNKQYHLLSWPSKYPTHKNHHPMCFSSKVMTTSMFFFFFLFIYFTNVCTIYFTL